MSAVYEHLGYNRLGLRWVTSKELREQKKRILNHDFSCKEDFQKSKNGSVIMWFAKLLARTISRQEEKKRIAQQCFSAVPKDLFKTR